jgi:hypothetical protein
MGHSVLIASSDANSRTQQPRPPVRVQKALVPNKHDGVRRQKSDKRKLMTQSCKGGVNNSNGALRTIFPHLSWQHGGGIFHARHRHFGF